MQTIQTVRDEHSGTQTKRLFDILHSELGLTPRMMGVMVQSPATLEGYLNLTGALSNGELSPRLREQIALTVAQANGCEHSLAAHTSLARKAGMTEDEILFAREARAGEWKADVALKFVRDLVVSRGRFLPEYLRQVRQAGHTDQEIVEMVALTVLNIFGNYFNEVASHGEDGEPRSAAA